MKPAKFLDVAATIMLFIGLSLAFLPHAVHTAAFGSFGEEDHTKHVIAGMIITVISLGALIWNNRRLNKLNS